MAARDRSARCGYHHVAVRFGGGILAESDAFLHQAKTLREDSLVATCILRYRFVQREALRAQHRLLPQELFDLFEQLFDLVTVTFGFNFQVGLTAGVFLVCRCSPLFELAPSARDFVVLIGATTAFFAASVGLFQHDIKRVIDLADLTRQLHAAARRGGGVVRQSDHLRQ